SLSPRQCPDRYAFRAGRNLPDKEFRYLRTVIVTAAVHRGFGRRLPCHQSPGPGHCDPLCEEAPLLPKLRGYFAEFLRESCLAPLGILYLPTCVGFGYRYPFVEGRSSFSWEYGMGYFSAVAPVSNQNTQQALALPEKEVIQPHLPVRLPCYDFTPVTSPAFGIPLLAVKLGSFHRLSRVEPWDLTADLKSHLQTLYAQSFRITLASSAFYLHAALLRQAFAHCGKFPTAASRRSLGRVSVPVWLIILSDQLLIIALPFPAVVPLPRAGSYALLTRPPLETPLPVRLACVKHAASVHPEPGSNSP
ncbi:ATP synthase subunit alpha, partial [Quillaja saponaria]